MMRSLLLVSILAVSSVGLAQSLQPYIPQAERVLEFEFPGLEIGVAEYAEGPTGATVFHFPQGASVAVDVRGGAPGTIGTDFLRLAYDSPFVDAITFSGGSSYGLSVATGVAEALRDRRGSGEWGNIATVSGAIIFDLGNRRFNALTPDAALGRAALEAAVPGQFPLGPHGAGRFAMQGGWFDSRRYPEQGGFYDSRQHSGQGAAFAQAGPTRIAVFTVVNSLGTIVDRDGQVVRCKSDPDADCGPVSDTLRHTLAARNAVDTAGGEPPVPTRNTTLTLVVTNQKLEFWALQRLAVQVHTSMARAIQPFQTSNDGDVLFAATTGEIDNEALRPVDLGVLAGELAWDAVLASVPELPRIDTTPVPMDAATVARAVGRYDFGQGARLELRLAADGKTLLACAIGQKPVYGFTEEDARLTPVAGGQLLSDNPRADRLALVEEQGEQLLILNPGHWQQRARKIE